jgi:hypothetical protein
VDFSVTDRQSASGKRAEVAFQRKWSCHPVGPEELREHDRRVPTR